MIYIGAATDKAVILLSIRVNTMKNAVLSTLELKILPCDLGMFSKCMLWLLHCSAVKTFILIPHMPKNVHEIIFSIFAKIVYGRFRKTTFSPKSPHLQKFSNHLQTFWFQTCN